MSFLEELQKRKQQLKETETVVTMQDGQRFIQNKDCTKTRLLPCHGFVVDTKPDNTPVLVTEYLYVGSQDCVVDNVLNAFNIKHVLSLGIDVDCDVNHRFVQCLDIPETDIKPLLTPCLQFIRAGVILKENVLVHCNAGVSRTCMVAIAYLMHYENMEFEEAYQLVKQKRPAVQPNDGFKRQLKNFTPGHII